MKASPLWHSTCNEKLLFVFCFLQLLDWINKTLPWLQDRNSDGNLNDMQVKGLLLFFWVTLGVEIKPTNWVVVQGT